MPAGIEISTFVSKTQHNRRGLQHPSHATLHSARPAPCCASTRDKLLSCTSVGACKGCSASGRFSVVLCLKSELESEDSQRRCRRCCEHSNHDAFLSLFLVADMAEASENTPLLARPVSTAAGSGSATPTNRRSRFRRPFSGWLPAEVEPQPFCGSANNLCDTCWPKIYSVVLAAGLGGLLFGYDSSDISIALPVRSGLHSLLFKLGVRAREHHVAAPKLHQSYSFVYLLPLLPVPAPCSQFIARSFRSVAQSNWLKEAVVSMTTLGAAIGGFFGGFASDWYGRRSAMIGAPDDLQLASRVGDSYTVSIPLSASLTLMLMYGCCSAGADVVFIVGALKAGSALDARELIVARFIIGTAVGLTSICGPIYIAESAPRHLRAMMVVMYNVEVGIGTVRSRTEPISTPFRTTLCTLFTWERRACGLCARAEVHGSTHPCALCLRLCRAAFPNLAGTCFRGGLRVLAHEALVAPDARVRSCAGAPSGYCARLLPSRDTPVVRLL